MVVAPWVAGAQIQGDGRWPLDQQRMPILPIHTLANPPIEEAVIDFRVRNPGSLNPEAFSQLSAELVAEFPTMRRVNSREAVVNFGGTAGATASATIPTPHGIFFASADEHSVAQFRRDGFTLNRLRPYTSWEQFSPMALRLWARYLDVAKSESVNRLAVRFINHVTLRADQPLEAVLQAIPVRPAGAPTEYEGFAGQVRLVDRTTGVRVGIVTVLEPGGADAQPRLIVDIDTYMHDDGGFEFDTVAARLETLREAKNRIFFSTFTDAAIRGFS